MGCIQLNLNLNVHYLIRYDWVPNGHLEGPTTFFIQFLSESYPSMAWMHMCLDNQIPLYKLFIHDGLWASIAVIINNYYYFLCRRNLRWKSKKIEASILELGLVVSWWHRWCPHVCSQGSIQISTVCHKDLLLGVPRGPPSTRTKMGLCDWIIRLDF